MATDTAVLPVTEARYQLRPDRCVVEAAYQLFGQALWRRRLPAESGTLTIGLDTTMDIELSWLDRTVEFTGQATSELTSVSGTVRLRAEEHELTLRLRRVPADPDTVLLAGRGVLRLRRPLVIDIAAEFTR